MTGQSAQIQYTGSSTGKLTHNKVYDIVAWIGWVSGNSASALIADDNGAPYGVADVNGEDWSMVRF